MNINFLISELCQVGELLVKVTDFILYYSFALPKTPGM